ncbi:hypothetical protein BN1221_02312 [Brenneria goodwinii]|uniref:Uncharacterized protein n=1 Tax=Brenneria goodwinii TaxID=1109412 RepID=A0A0G4JVA1_9GAMM|nr:hypothetical protein BN1221_02312 [Brenneria goodwinii]
MIETVYFFIGKKSRNFPLGCIYLKKHRGLAVLEKTACFNSGNGGPA